MTTYAEALKDSLNKVDIDSIGMYPLTVSHFMKSMCFAYLHVASCVYMSGHPAYEIAGEKFPGESGHMPTVHEVMRSIVGDDPLMYVPIGVEFNSFIQWLLDQPIPDDEDMVVWDEPHRIIDKINEWVSLPKSPSANP